MKIFSPFSSCTPFNKNKPVIPFFGVTFRISFNATLLISSPLVSSPFPFHKLLGVSGVIRGPGLEPGSFGARARSLKSWPFPKFFNNLSNTFVPARKPHPSTQDKYTHSSMGRWSSAYTFSMLDQKLRLHTLLRG